MSSLTIIQFPAEPAVGTVVESQCWTWTHDRPGHKGWLGTHRPPPGFDAEADTRVSWRSLASRVVGPAEHVFPPEPPVGAAVRTLTRGVRWYRDRHGWFDGTRHCGWPSLLEDHGPVTLV